jgi:hypothetical protein
MVWGSVGGDYEMNMLHCVAWSLNYYEEDQRQIVQSGSEKLWGKYKQG